MEMTNKTKGVINKVIYTGIILCAIAVGGVVQKIYSDQKVKYAKTHRKVDVKTFRESSVAFTERGELLIINRKTWVIENIYQDSLGRAIYKMYAGKIYSQEND
jgi:hypothetical protein